MDGATVVHGRDERFDPFFFLRSDWYGWGLEIEMMAVEKWWNDQGRVDIVCQEAESHIAGLGIGLAFIHAAIEAILN